MPEFVFAGQLPRSYTELRDESGDIVGTILHGAKRDLAQAPPDGLWLDGDAKIAPAWDGVSADMYRLPESREDEDEPDAEPETPAVPAGRVTTARASLAGSASGGQPDTTTPADDDQKDEG
jgi:hypothetical protein